MVRGSNHAGGARHPAEREQAEGVGDAGSGASPAAAALRLRPVTTGYAGGCWQSRDLGTGLHCHPLHRLRAGVQSHASETPLPQLRGDLLQGLLGAHAAPHQCPGSAGETSTRVRQLLCR